jgi:hypothetical protein
MGLEYRWHPQKHGVFLWVYGDHCTTTPKVGSDKLELLMWRRVCVDKTITLDQAKTAYLKGWTKVLP